MCRPFCTVSKTANSKVNGPTVKADMVSVAVQIQIDDQTSSTADVSDLPQHRVGDSDGSGSRPKLPVPFIRNFSRFSEQAPASDLQLCFAKSQSDVSFLDGSRDASLPLRDFVASDSCI